MSRIQDEKGRDDRFQQNIEDKLYQETFNKDVSQFSPDKIEHLVSLLDLEDPINQEELDTAKQKLKEQFHAQNLRSSRKRPKWYHFLLLNTYGRIALSCVLLLLFLMTADVTTNAVTDSHLFHMISRWKGQLAVRPGKPETEETVSFKEGSPLYFHSLEEFAKFYKEDFLYCSWLPEGIELDRIVVKQDRKFLEIFNTYCNQSPDQSDVQMWIYQYAEKVDTGGVVGDLSEDAVGEDTIGQFKVTYYENEKGYFASFVYNDDWYLINVGASKTDLKLIIRGMMKYEETDKN